MKHVDTWLNEEEYKELNHRAKKLQMTRYAIVKKLVKDFLEDKTAVSLCFLTWPIYYALIVAATIMV